MKGIDYSKWDNIDDSDSEADQVEEESIMPPQQQSQQQHFESSVVTKKGGEKGRYRCEYGGRLIYEWDQNLEEVNIYVNAPSSSIKASHITCKIYAQKLELGLVGNKEKYLDESTFGKVIVNESSWFLADGIIQIVLVKANRGLTWDSALLGRQGAAVDPFTRQDIQKEMMLERFQEENPGFDFRDAEFNGNVPDPRTFMGGVSYHN